MKNKRNNYVLGVAVLIVWGLIANKIYDAIKPQEAIVKATHDIVVFKPKDVIKKDSFSMLAPYRDPFLGTLVTVRPKSKKKVIAIHKVQIVFPSIVYKGMISPQNKKSSPIFLVQISGVQYLLKFQKEEQGVQLISGGDKEIVLEYKKRRQSFEIQN